MPISTVNSGGSDAADQLRDSLLVQLGVEMKINNMLLKEAYNLDFKEDDTIGE